MTYAHKSFEVELDLDLLVRPCLYSRAVQSVMGQAKQTKTTKAVFGIKIRKLVEGKYRYSRGGSINPNVNDDVYKRCWSEKGGKVWATEGHAKSHLTMITESRNGRRYKIPNDWELVIMYEDGTAIVRPARELAERPAKK